MPATSFNNDLLQFIYQSPTPFHATAKMKKKLLSQGFQLLSESEAWQLIPGNKYIVTRNDSSLLAFIYGKKPLLENGIRLVGGHTDSPCLRVKPNADIKTAGYWQVGVEVYGGALLNPWFDRELGLAGRVSVLDSDEKLHHLLINFENPIGMIPSLAIHLDREANKNRSINAQKELPVLLGAIDNLQYPDFHALLMHQLHHQYPDLSLDKVLDFEMSFYDTQPGTIYGVNNDYMASARFDNLLSCYVGLQALISADTEQSCLLICSDHEEIGSTSAVGADGTFLTNFLQRLLPDVESYQRVIAHSMLVSADNAHGIHPNFTEKHDINHGPLLNAGPVIKVNANHRYASTSETQSTFRALCEAHDIPVQTFVVRSDMGCGSTIGPITASQLGVRTVDVGVPTFAMHSIRETAGTKDAWYLYQVLQQFYGVAQV